MDNGQQRKLGKTLRGIVCSDKMDKTVTVSVTRKVQHPVYKKFITRTKKYHAHDESNACKSGDVVMIVEASPYSKLKRWRVSEIVERNRE